MSLNTIGSIANFIINTIDGVSDGVSGNMTLIVDLNRQSVENFVGVDIGSNSIQDEYQPPIVNFSKADTIDFIQAQEGGEDIMLAELKINETGEQMSSKMWRDLANSQLNSIGRKVEFRRSIA